MARESLNKDSQIYKLRKALKINQKKFGESIGLSESSVSNLEKGRYSLTDSNIKLICATYNVSESWLRTGDGEMFVEMNVDDEFDTLIGELLADDASGLDVEFKKEFISYLLKLDEVQWENIKLFIDTLARK